MDKQNSSRAGNGWRLLLVQSISCAVLILAVLILRLAGGGIFLQLKEYFEEAMRQNALAAAIHALWEDEVTYTSVTDPEDGTAVPSDTEAETTGTTAETAPSAVPSAVPSGDV